MSLVNVFYALKVLSKTRREMKFYARIRGWYVSEKFY